METNNFLVSNLISIKQENSIELDISHYRITNPAQ